MRKLKALALILMLAVMAFGFAGCDSTDKTADPYDEKPWTSQESWETGMPGIPF